MEDFFSFMECYGCGNCKQGKLTYYCLMKDEFVVSDESKNLVVEKSRSGRWKKGAPEYEGHRRKSRKIDVV